MTATHGASLNTDTGNTVLAKKLNLIAAVMWITSTTVPSVADKIGLVGWQVVLLSIIVTGCLSFAFLDAAEIKERK